MTVPVSIPVPTPLVAERDGSTWWVEADGIRVPLSNLDKVYWGPEGYTKGDLLAYYHAIAPTILPYLRDRPLTMKRMPDGADGDFFYAKQAPAGTPSWMQTAPVVSEDTGKRIDYLLANDTASLLHIANLGCIEMHPWHARTGDLGHPDYAFFDLDPFDVGFAVVRDVALLIKTVLDQLGLRGYPRTSGATGMQVYVPVDRVHTAATIRDWVGLVCRLVNRADPGHTTMEWDISKRSGKVFLDHGMNTEGRNIAATYSVRPEREAPVATPLSWDEVETDVEPTDFTIATIWPRLERLGDLFLPVLEGGQDLTAAMAAVGMDPDEQPDDARHHVSTTRSGSDPDPAMATPEEPGELGTYEGMRDFTRTGEPPATSHAPSPTATASSGGTTSGGTSRRFVIQHHLATRLHHDLRLERGGTARSWAIPKGLPDRGGVRHLAVQTEDHPLDYMTYEGVIPEGEYGAGPVRIWDHGSYRPLEWTDDKVTFALDGGRHRGEWHLFRPSPSDPRQWLVTRKGQPEQLPPPPPAFSPMLAGETTTPFDDDDWLFEVKWDGVRAIATLMRPVGEEDGRTRLMSRAGNELTAGYPELRSLWERLLARNAVVDGELVALDENARPSFQRLQQRLHVRDEAALERLRRRLPVTYMVFDLLALDGEALIDRPLRERLGMLDDVLVPGGSWERSRPIPGRGTALYEAVRAQGLEGIVAKRADAPYVPGRRVPTWRKIKIRRTVKVVIGGWMPGKGTLDGLMGSLAVGVWHEGTFCYIGRVGTGFDEAERTRIAAQLSPLATDANPFGDLPPELGTGRDPQVHFVRPELVCCVEFAEFTDGGRLRAPSYKGLLPDEDPRTVLIDELRGASSQR